MPFKLEFQGWSLCFHNHEKKKTLIHTTFPEFHQNHTAYNQKINLLKIANKSSQINIYKVYSTLELIKIFVQNSNRPATLLLSSRAERDGNMNNLVWSCCCCFLYTRLYLLQLRAFANSANMFYIITFEHANRLVLCKRGSFCTFIFNRCPEKRTTSAPPVEMHSLQKQSMHVICIWKIMYM